ncbi:MAG: LysR family transcriptional regulator [Proteobacteria bacterium]|nr:LysR family transcriptional regulator [Pseudomonadota bacterium]
MNLKQLRAFAEVMETGSVSEAARRLHRSQPAISALIASLENELGIGLFTRTGMRLKPAPEAHFLLREAHEILNRVDKARSTMLAVRDSKVGQLELASMPGPAIYLLPKLIDRFLGERCDIEVNLITRSSPEIEQLVSAQNVEMGFADYHLLNAYDSDLVSFDLYEFECLCAMRSDDPLAGKSLITPDELDGKTLATLHPEHSTTIQVANAFKAADARMVVGFNAQYFIPLFTFVERRSVYSLVDLLSVKTYLTQHQGNDRKLVFRPFAPRVSLRATIITPNHKPISSLTREFLEFFKQALSSIQQKDYT